jgi:hypothetical protein
MDHTRVDGAVQGRTWKWRLVKGVLALVAGRAHEWLLHRPLAGLSVLFAGIHGVIQDVERAAGAVIPAAGQVWNCRGLRIE